ncbi:probable splicing factor, arginine/serine-rich 7 [Dermacentor andersoni]|uniref:probable splicing factor, arginine/serine-rich 7 n=1 Tax=Dermacentor andersoni TaxID=34620 RepID=UPI002155D6E9|nr:probable splicing factor, arginine/serine-rich 7 [Dermacentor andersoni]
MDTCVIQVTNVAPTATVEQMSTLFGFLGKILELKMYPADEFLVHPVAKVCYIRFEESWSVGVAQHLTNTVFVDRALIVVPVADGKLPDESKALALTASATPPVEEPAPVVTGLVNQLAMGAGGIQVITTQDPTLAALGLPPYPPLPATMDPAKVEEIRRTVYVGNLDSSATTEQLLKFFSQMGEVKYVRMAGGESQPTRFAFVEFTEQSSVGRALQFNGIEFCGRSLKINHSNNAIVKPQAKSSEAAHKEIEEAMRRVREAQSLITAAIEPEMVKQPTAGSPLQLGAVATSTKRRSRSKSRSRRRSTRSRSHSSRRRSRSSSRRRSTSTSRHRRSHRRSRSRHRSPRRRRRSSSSRRSSRSRRHSRSRSPSSRKLRLKDPDRRRGDSPRERRRRKRSHTPRKSRRGSSPLTPPRRSGKKRHKSRSPKRSKSRKSSKEDTKAPVARDYDEEEKGYEPAREMSPASSPPSGDMDLASD